MPGREWFTAAIVLSLGLLPATAAAQALRRLPSVMPASEAIPPDEREWFVVPPSGGIDGENRLKAGLQTAGPDLPPDARPGVFQKLIVGGMWLAPGGSTGLGMSQLESKVVLGLPCPTIRSPLIITPGYAVYYLDGPEVIDVPPRVYDAAVEFRWMAQLLPRLGAEVAVKPGHYSDYEQGSDEAVRVTGHTGAMFTWNDRTKAVAGVAYLDRDDIDWLPIGGLILTPRDEWKLELVFPQPKIARRLYWSAAAAPNIEDWLYVSGEFGTNVWAVRRASGLDDELTYRDVRLLVGVERISIGGLDGKFEVGYVFGRRLHYRTTSPDLDLADTVLLRGSLLY